MDNFKGYTATLRVKPSEKGSDYAKLYKTILKVANSKEELSLEDAIKIVELVASTRMNEVGLNTLMICFRSDMEEGVKGSFDGENMQIYLPDTIFQQLSTSYSGRSVSPEVRVLNTLKDVNTIIHEMDHCQYETYTQGQLSLGVIKQLSKEDYRKTRLENLKKGIIKHKDTHFSSAKAIHQPDFEDKYDNIIFGKYFTSRYETRARTTALEYSRNIVTNMKRYVDTHPLDALTLMMSFSKNDSNFSLGKLITTFQNSARTLQENEDFNMRTNLARVQPERPIISAVAEFQEEYFETLPERETALIAARLAAYSKGATAEDLKYFQDLLAERELFQDSFSLVQNDDMAHQIVRMQGVNPSLKTATLLYSSASVSREEVEIIYRDERYYRAHPELCIEQNLLNNPSSFVEYTRSEISEIRNSVYHEGIETTTLPDLYQ